MNESHAKAREFALEIWQHTIQNTGRIHGLYKHEPLHPGIQFDNATAWREDLPPEFWRKFHRNI